MHCLREQSLGLVVYPEVWKSRKYGAGDTAGRGEEAGPAGGGGWSSLSAVEAAVFPAPWPTVVTVFAPSFFSLFLPGLESDF